MRGRVLDPRIRTTLARLSRHDRHVTAYPSLLAFAAGRALRIRRHEALR